MPAKKKIVKGIKKSTKRRKTVIPRSEPRTAKPPIVAMPTPKSKSSSKPKAKVKPVFVALPATTPAPVVVPAPIPAPPPPQFEITYEMISKRAYEIWESKVRSAYDAVQNWIEAEAQLKGAR